MVRSRATTSRRPADFGSDAQISSARATRSASDGDAARCTPSRQRISRCGASWLTFSQTVKAPPEVSGTSNSSPSPESASSNSSPSPEPPASEEASEPLPAAEEAELGGEASSWGASPKPSMPGGPKTPTMYPWSALAHCRAPAPLASSALKSSSDTALAPEAKRHCSSPSSAVIEAMNDDLPAPLESFGPAPATTMSVPGTVGTGWVDSREMLTACTAISTRSPTTFSTCDT